ncbi:MAG: DUF504 domain-containing protein [Gammaproteobacteria bacterium]|nr:DUF504 domain-containing protein [Gammaproteobacteria bacterium]
MKVTLNKIYFDKYDRFNFELTDDTGEHHSIPLHRISLVYRNGELTWQRKDANSWYKTSGTK